MNVLEKEYVKLGEFKQKYFGIFFSVCFSLGYLTIYQLGFETVFFNGVMIPVAFITLHASLRSKRNAKDMRNALGFRYQTPMGYILEGFGTSLTWLGLGVHSLHDWKMDSTKAYACLVQ